MAFAALGGELQCILVNKTEELRYWMDKHVNWNTPVPYFGDKRQLVQRTLKSNPYTVACYFAGEETPQIDEGDEEAYENIMKASEIFYALTSCFSCSSTT